MSGFGLPDPDCCTQKVLLIYFLYKKYLKLYHTYILFVSIMSFLLVGVPDSSGVGFKTDSKLQSLLYTT